MNVNFLSEDDFEKIVKENCMKLIFSNNENSVSYVIPAEHQGKRFLILNEILYIEELNPTKPESLDFYGTEGPWYITKNPIIEEGYIPISAKGHSGLAQVVVEMEWEGNEHEKTPENKSYLNWKDFNKKLYCNARLIAKSPELYNLVKELLENSFFYHSAVEQSSYDYDFTQWENKARELLKQVVEE